MESSSHSRTILGLYVTCHALATQILGISSSNLQNQEYERMCLHRNHRPILVAKPEALASFDARVGRVARRFATRQLGKIKRHGAHVSAAQR